MFIQEFYSNIHGIDTDVPQFVTIFRGTRIVVTLNLISEVLHIPRVAHPNYPSCEHLRTVFRDDFPSHFCEKPSLWGGDLNNPCSGFAKYGVLSVKPTVQSNPNFIYFSIRMGCCSRSLSFLSGLAIYFPT